MIGFDDVALAALAVPPLTTVRQPMEAMGSTAADIIAETVTARAEKQEVTAVHRILPPELVVRQSTRQVAGPQ